MTTQAAPSKPHDPPSAARCEAIGCRYFDVHPAAKTVLIKVFAEGDENQLRQDLPVKKNVRQRHIKRSVSNEIMGAQIHRDQRTLHKIGVC